jgi:ectoine hydroxylase-related dioxygenase (phytanoyl-CoA dioxygenase family)
MSQVAKSEIISQDIEAFERDGVICLRGIFDDTWVERMRVAIDRALTNPGPLSDDVINGGRFLNDNFLWTRDEDFRAFVFSSSAAELASQLLKTEKVNLLADNLLVKEPGANTPVSWHNDQPYWPVQGGKLCSIWLALDYVTQESGALKYIKGSHKWGKQLRAQENPGGLVKRESHEFVFWDLEPGDCLVHHMLTLHSSAANTSSRRRRGLVTVWAGDDVTYNFLADSWFLRSVNKLGIPECDSIWALKTGEPIDCALFPQVLPRLACVL